MKMCDTCGCEDGKKKCSGCGKPVDECDCKDQNK